MSSRRIRFRHSLALRLTLWYAGIFLVSAGVAFAFCYYFITATIRERTDQDLLAEVRAFANLMGLQGVDAVMRRAALDSQAAGEKKIFIRLLTPDGRVFSSSNMDYWRNIFISGEAIRRLIDENRPIYATMRSPDGLHEVRVLYAFLGPGLVIQLGQAMDDLTRLIEAFRRIFAVSMTALLLSAAVMGWFMARRALAGVAVVTRTARRIADGNLTERVPVKRHGDEVDQLALTFNQMVDRIQVLVTGIKEMTDNIAHDLKSPITRIRGQAEVALTAGGPAQDYEALAAGAIEECDRLLEMIDAMLFISRSEAGVTRPELKEMDLAAVVRDACGLFQALAEEKRIGLAWEAPQSLTIAADIRLIQRMLANLLDNAIKYTPEGGAVSVALRATNGQTAAIEVRDSGVGISPADLPHIFERFYRGDPSRSQPGAGLGLSFARAVARAHGGEISAAGQADSGSVFTVTLPIQPHFPPPCPMPLRDISSY
jgi:heavy metal sensor kinase